MTLTFGASVVAGAATGVLAETTAHSGVNVAISAAVTVIVGVLATAALRSLRGSRTDHAVNRAILNEVKDGLFGHPERTVNGIRHDAVMGVIDQVACIDERITRLDEVGSAPMRDLDRKLDELAQATNERIARLEAREGK